MIIDEGQQEGHPEVVAALDGQTHANHPHQGPLATGGGHESTLQPAGLFGPVLLGCVPGLLCGHCGAK